MKTATFRIWRGNAKEGRFEEYETNISEGMVVLDAVHQIQEEKANDLAVRWNCKAGKCGSCSAEINGIPKLMCMTRLNEIPLDKPVTIEPMKAFTLIRDLVTNVSWNYDVKKKLKKLLDDHTFFGTYGAGAAHWACDRETGETCNTWFTSKPCRKSNIFKAQVIWFSRS